MSLNGNYDFVVNGLSAAEEMLCFKAADIETWRKRERQQLCTRYPTPLFQLARTLYHNAEKLSSVWRQFFKKISRDFFCLGGGHFFSLNAERVISVLFFSNH